MKYLAYIPLWFVFLMGVMFYQTNIFGMLSWDWFDLTMGSMVFLGYCLAAKLAIDVARSA